MDSWQDQAEREMWDAASRDPGAPLEYTYSVIVGATGARCLSTNSYEEARVRAVQVGGHVVGPDGRAVCPVPDWDPHLDHPERYADGYPV